MAKLKKKRTAKTCTKSVADYKKARFEERKLESKKADLIQDVEKLDTLGSIVCSILAHIVYTSVSARKLDEVVKRYNATTIYDLFKLETLTINAFRNMIRKPNICDLADVELLISMCNHTYVGYANLALDLVPIVRKNIEEIPILIDIEFDRKSVNPIVYSVDALNPVKMTHPKKVYIFSRKVLTTITGKTKREIRECFESNDRLQNVSIEGFKQALNENLPVLKQLLSDLEKAVSNDKAA